MIDFSGARMLARVLDIIYAMNLREEQLFFYLSTVINFMLFARGM